MIPLLEEAGYGIVVYDYPYNRASNESSRICARLGRVSGESAGRLPWSIVAHSMGALVAGSLVEDKATGRAMWRRSS